MRRFWLRVVLLLLCGAMVFPVRAQDEEINFVLDNAKVLNSGHEAKVQGRLALISEDFQVYLYFMTEETTGEMDPMDYAEKYYISNGLGYGKNRDGILLFLCMDRHEWLVYTAGVGMDVLSDEDIDAIGEKFAPKLAEGKYADAALIFAEECVFLLDARTNVPHPIWDKLAVVAVGAACGALIVFGIVRKRNHRK